MTSEIEFYLPLTGSTGNMALDGNSEYVRLNKLAERRRWSPYHDLPWSRAGVCNTQPHKDRSPFGNPLHGFPPYEALDPINKNRADHQRLSLELSEILHGEVLALLVSAQLVNLLADQEAKNFAAIQAADEARHVSFFREYMREHRLPVAAPSRALQQLSLATLQDPLWQHKILCCQIVIESLALAQFSWMRTIDIPPLLREGLGRILEDEARHVKFGVVLLDDYFRNLPVSEQEEHSAYVMNSVMQLSPSDNHLTQLATDWDWSPHALRHHLRSRRTQLPALYQARFRQLSLNLRKIGLLTPGATARLQRFMGKANAV